MASSLSAFVHAPDTPQPVSYTHLDVYKRQVLQKAVSVLPEECKERPTVQKVSKWVEANGYLVNSGSGRRPGPRAAEIGLAAQQVKAKDGKWYQTNLYGEKAQAFLLEHMTQIME